MAEKKELSGPAAVAVRRLEAARPVDEATGKALSDNRWCELAGLNTGFWRDLRNGREPSVNKLAALAKVAGVSLTDLLAAAEPVSSLLPSAEALTEMVAGMLDAADRPDLAAELAPRLAQLLPNALERALARQSTRASDAMKPLVGEIRPPAKGRRGRPSQPST